MSKYVYAYTVGYRFAVMSNVFVAVPPFNITSNLSDNIINLEIQKRFIEGKYKNSLFILLHVNICPYRCNHTVSSVQNSIKPIIFITRLSSFMITEILYKTAFNRNTHVKYNKHVNAMNFKKILYILQSLWVGLAI